MYHKPTLINFKFKRSEIHVCDDSIMPHFEIDANRNHKIQTVKGKNCLHEH